MILTLTQIAFIYVFNLIVGAGALALPQAFARTGWILGIAAMAILALMRYIYFDDNIVKDILSL